MPGSPQRASVRFALSEDPLGPTEAASWIGPLVVLGSRASRYVGKLDGRQLIVAVSVPRRDFAAALICCGWVMATPAPCLDAPLDFLRTLEPRTPVRVVTEGEVIADYFVRLDERRGRPRVQLRESQWELQGIKAVARLTALDAPARAPRPGAGSAARHAGLEPTWDERLAAPTADLAIVGTLKWLQEDFDAFLTKEREPLTPYVVADLIRHVKAKSKVGQMPVGPGTIADLLLPEGREAATWFTRLYASSSLGVQLPLPKEVRAVVLDGAGAIKYVAEIEAPVVLCVLDRSVADETAAEIVVQLRNTRGEPVSIRDDLGWPPPTGVEALAFTLAL